MNSQPFCSTWRTCQKLFQSTSALFSSLSVLLKMSTYSFSQRRMLKCCEKIFAPMSIRSLFSEASVLGLSRLKVSEISSFWRAGTGSFLVEVVLALSAARSSWGSSLFCFLQVWRKGKGASKPQRWQAAMKLLTLSSQVFLPLVQAQRQSLPICTSLATGKPYCRLSPALQTGVSSAKSSFSSSMEKKPWFSSYFLEKARLSVAVMRFLEARYSSSMSAMAQSKSQYSTLSNTLRSLSSLARRRERWYSSVKQRQIFSSFFADFLSTQVAPSSSTQSKVASLRWMERKKFWALQSRRQLKPSGFSKSGWQRITSMSWQNSQARCQQRLQYLRDIMNSSSFTSASLRILCFCRKQNTTNSSNSIPLPMPPAISSPYSAFLCAMMSAISCLVYSQGSTFPASLSFDMFSRKASSVGVSAQGFSACFARLKLSCGCERSLSFSWSMRCGWEEARATAAASAQGKGRSSGEQLAKMAPACVRSSLSSTCVPVVTLEHLVMDLMSSRMLPREFPAERCSFSMLLSRMERVLSEPLIWSLPSSSSCAFRASRRVKQELTFCMSPWSSLQISRISPFTISNSVSAMLSCTLSSSRRCSSLSTRSLQRCCSLSSSLFMRSSSLILCSFSSMTLSLRLLSFTITARRICMLSAQLSSSSEESCGLYSLRFSRCSRKLLWAGSSVRTSAITSSGMSNGKSFTQTQKSGMVLSLESRVEARSLSLVLERKVLRLLGEGVPCMV